MQQLMFMKKTALALTLVLLILITAIAAGILLVNLAKDEEAAPKLYTCPVSVGEKTYIIMVETNWTSTPKVYLPEFDSKYVSVDFMGPKNPIFGPLRGSSVVAEWIRSDDSTMAPHRGSTSARTRSRAC